MAATVMMSLLISVLTVHQSSIADAAANYNSDTQICCNGTVSPKGENSGCCGMVAYDYDKSGCCGDKEVPLPAGGAANFGCCYGASSDASKTYDTSTHTCCDGIVLENPANASDQFYGCCSGKLFDYSTQLCCDDQVHKRDDGDECCGDKIYNSKSQLCCEKWAPVGDGGRWQPEYSEILDRKGNHTFCCGKAVYDQNQEVCCNDEIRPKPDDIEPGNAGCCDKDIYDFSSQICCQNYQNVSGVFQAIASKVHSKKGDTSICCGTKVFDFQESVCCNDTVLPKPEGMDKNVWGSCCGDKVMTSFELQMCVNGAIVERNSTDIWACGDDGKVFNLTSQACCFGEVLDDSSDLGCCYSASKTFNKKSENCCGEEIIPLSPQDLSDKNLACCTTLPKYIPYLPHKVSTISERK